MSRPSTQPAARHRGGVPPGRSRHRRPGQLARTRRSCPPAGSARASRSPTSCCRPRSRSARALCPDIGAARAELLRLRAHRGRRRARAHGMALVAASTHPFASWTDQQQHRQGTLPDADRGLPGAGPAAGDQRHARPCRDRGRGPAHRPDEPGRLLPAASPGALDQLAVLGAATTPGSRPIAARSPTTCRARARPRALRELARVAAPGRDPGRDRPGRRPDPDLVGRPPLGQAPDAGAADHRHLHRARGRADHRRPLPVAAAPSLAPAHAQPELAASTAGS